MELHEECKVVRVQRHCPMHWSPRQVTISTTRMARFPQVGYWYYPHAVEVVMGPICVLPRCAPADAVEKSIACTA